jgi:hypothetical protein
LSQARQCGEEVFRIFVTAGPQNVGGGIPQRISTISCSSPVLRTTGAGWSGKTPGIGGRLPA